MPERRHWQERHAWKHRGHWAPRGWRTWREGALRGTPHFAPGGEGMR